jgi:GNAT superfamily N-acetyltransferase
MYDPEMLRNLTIRPAIKNERKPLEDLQRRASLFWPDYREALLAHPDAIDLPIAHIESGGTYVAEHNAQILGFAVILTRPDGDSDLDGLFVDPPFWNQGIGRALIHEAERQAASNDARFLHVIANPKALGFYKSCAFELTGTAETRFGSAHTMRKRIP